MLIQFPVTYLNPKKLVQQVISDTCCLACKKVIQILIFCHCFAIAEWICILKLFITGMGLKSNHPVPAWQLLQPQRILPSYCKWEAPISLAPLMLTLKQKHFFLLPHET